jgi:hypothetical protein
VKTPRSREILKAVTQAESRFLAPLGSVDGASLNPGGRGQSSTIVLQAVWYWTTPLTDSCQIAP